VPVIISDSTSGSGSNTSKFEMVTKKKGKSGQEFDLTAQWTSGTPGGGGSMLTTTVETTLDTMFLTNPFQPSDMINSVVIDLSGSLQNPSTSFLPVNANYNPAFGATSSLFATLTIGTFSTVINPLAANVDLTGALAEILAGNNFQLDWVLRTVFSANFADYASQLTDGTTTWTALGSYDFVAQAVISAEMPQADTSIPEPGTMLLLSSALAGLIWYRRRH
jgi:hypothetical protein